MQPQPERVGHIDFAGWLIRLITWDGVMPVCVIAAPFVVEWIVPNRRGAIEITAVALPIVAFFARIVSGSRHISRNNCGIRVRAVQRVVLFVSVFILVFIDAVLILSHVMPKGALIANRGDRIVLAVLAAGYFLSMAVAMYPGRAHPLPEVFRPESN